MLLPLILPLVMAVLVKGVPMQPECCETKDVGGVSYTLVGQMDTSNYQCLNDCIYTKDEDPQYKYCFAAGDLEVDCTEDELENSGTEKSPVEETEAPAGPTVAPPTGTTIPNPGGSAEELTLTLVQSWSQETDYSRTAKVAVPATTAGQKVPVVFHLHGNGGQGNTRPVGGWLGDDCIIVAPDGYERSWNVYTEKSKADDVSFILDLITKIGAEIPAADMNNVNIIGTSNGAALTYRLMIETGADRPFRRAFPMVSSLISPQYHDDQFWSSSVSAAPGEANVYDTPVVPVFADNFEYAHFHGTEDGALQYEGQSPGPSFLGGADVIAAQKTDYLWA